MYCLAAGSSRHVGKVLYGGENVINITIIRTKYCNNLLITTRFKFRTARIEAKRVSTDLHHQLGKKRVHYAVWELLVYVTIMCVVEMFTTNFTLFDVYTELQFDKTRMCVIKRLNCEYFYYVYIISKNCVFETIFH